MNKEAASREQKLLKLRKLSFFRIAVSIFLFAIVFSSVADAQSLYKRIGGYDAIAAVTDDFIGKLATNPQLGKFFGGVSADSQKKIRMHLIDLVCEASGGPAII